mgnify:CR=1 FL=1
MSRGLGDVYKRQQKALAKGYHPIEVRYFDSNGGMLKMEVRDSKENVIPVDGLFAK